MFYWTLERVKLWRLLINKFKKVNFNNNTDENVSEQLSSHSSIFITSHNSSLGRKGDSSPSEWGFEQAINSSNENLNQ